MVKKSLFRGILLISFLAVLSTAHAMDNNNNNIEEKNIEKNREFIYVTAKQLKKGFKEGSIDIEGKKFSVESLSKPNFDLIALAKNIQGIKKEEGVFKKIQIKHLKLHWKSDLR